MVEINESPFWIGTCFFGAREGRSGPIPDYVFIPPLAQLFTQNGKKVTLPKILSPIIVKVYIMLLIITTMELTKKLEKESLLKYRGVGGQLPVGSHWDS